MQFYEKELRKAIMKRSKPRNKSLKTRNEESKKRFNRQSNFCFSFLDKTKRRLFGKLDHSLVSSNRKFWKTVIPLFSEKAFHKESTLVWIITTKLLVKWGTTILAIIFWDFLMFYQIFLSPQVKRIVIIDNKHGIYELPHTLPNDLRLRILGN